MITSLFMGLSETRALFSLGKLGTGLAKVLPQSDFTYLVYIRMTY